MYRYLSNVDQNKSEYLYIAGTKVLRILREKIYSDLNNNINGMALGRVQINSFKYLNEF